MRNINICLLMASLFILRVQCKSDHQPAYQVALYIHLHPRGPPIHLCNGVIVQSRLVLTTATCVHHQFMPDTPPVQVHPALLSVVAGSTDAFNEAAILSVSAININTEFNLTTLDNDLALLHLSTSLELGDRDDMKWIVLDSYEEEAHSQCLLNFYTRNSLNRGTGHNRVEQLEAYASEECLKLVENKQAREQDICAQYVPSKAIKCETLTSAQHYTGNGDRGTGVVCGSYLVALLSTVFPYANAQNCSEGNSLKAFYTNVGEHLDWIYEIIAQEEYIDIVQGNSTYSAPYQEEAFSAFQQPAAAPSTTDLIPAVTTSATYTEVVTQSHVDTFQAHLLASGCSRVQYLSTFTGGMILIILSQLY